jgi:hypothetical protein
MDASFNISKIAAELIDRNSEKIWKKFGEIIKDNYKKFKSTLDLHFRIILKNHLKNIVKLKLFCIEQNPLSYMISLNAIHCL